ncbi:MAG TPA: hypothetical protein VIG66_04365, partial [Noviherbaspirillum sp.]
LIALSQLPPLQEIAGGIGTLLPGLQPMPAEPSFKDGEDTALSVATSSPVRDEEDPLAQPVPETADEHSEGPAGAPVPPNQSVNDEPSQSQ